MNQKCKVCGEPAAGFHFGAFTCEGCKSFFGRSYNNLNSITECKNNGECVINKKNRTACKACRLRKCLLVGMSKSGSRYGRRSNWFKIHCLLQEQQQAAAAAAGAGAAPGVGTGSCGGARSSPHLPPHHHGPSHHLAPPFPPHLFPGLARPRKEDLALLHYEDLKGSPCLGSPDSHKSSSSPATEDLKGVGGGGGMGRDAFVPLPMQSLAHFPPSAFLPPPAFNPFAGAHPLLFSGALLGSPALLPRALLDSAALRHHNNNNDVLLDDHNADSSKRFYLDEVLKSQRLPLSPPNLPREEEPSPGRGLQARAGGGVRGRRSSESPLQENPMDLSVRSDGRGADSSDSDDEAEGEGGDASEEGEEDGEGEGGAGHEHQREHEHDHSEPAYAHLKRIKLHPLDLTTRV